MQIGEKMAKYVDLSERVSATFTVMNMKSGHNGL